MKSKHIWQSIACLALLCSVRAGMAAVIAPPYDSDYGFLDLGSASGVPGSYGGITFLNNSTILLGGSANGGAGAIYSVPVIRDGDNHITGLGAGTLYAAAPFIDGGLAFGPGGVLFYTTYSNNTIGQIKPGSIGPDKIVDLNPLGVVPSTGTLQFGPFGLKIASYSAGTWYDATLTPDGTGTYDIAVSHIVSSDFLAQPEGIAYVPLGSAGFPNPSVLISEFGSGRVSAYEVDANGDPIPASRTDFMTGLAGAEGATIDPLTGDFLFSTFGGGNKVFVVSGGFAAPEGAVPEPASLVVWGLGMVGCAVGARRRKKLV